MTLHHHLNNISFSTNKILSAISNDAANFKDNLDFFDFSKRIIHQNKKFLKKNRIKITFLKNIATSIDWLALKGEIIAPLHHLNDTIKLESLFEENGAIATFKGKQNK